MPTLVKFLFQMTTRQSVDAPIPRTAGWSEAFWCNNNDLVQVRDLITAPGGVLGSSIIARRLAMLPPQGSLVGYRLQAYNIVNNVLVPTGGALPILVASPGAYTTLNDIPGMGLQFSMAHTNQPVKTQLVIRGMPNARVVAGELTTNADWDTRMQNWLNAMGANFGSVIQQKAGVVSYKVVSIDGAGVLTAKVPTAGIAVNQFVNVKRSKDEGGVKRGAKLKVLAVGGGGKTLTLQGWPWGPTRGGSVMLYVRDFTSYDSTNSRAVRVVPRKVGGPFVRFHGKSSPKLA